MSEPLFAVSALSKEFWVCLFVGGIVVAVLGTVDEFSKRPR